MNENRAKQRLASGGSVIAITINFVHAGLAEHLGRLGYDVVIVDGEHGSVVDRDVEEFARACDVAGATPILRLPPNATLMERYLAMGVHGFQVPRVQSVDEARAVVKATKFAPLGARGLGIFRATDYGATLGQWPAFMEKANANTMIQIMVEDREGLAALPEIVRIPEIDVVIVGWLDVSAAFGVPGQIKHPTVVEAFRNAVEVVQAAGKILGMGIGTAGDIKAGHALGARYFITSVTAVLAQGSTPLLGTMKELR